MGKRMNTQSFVVTRDTQFNLPAHWLGKVVNGVRIDTILLNLSALPTKDHDNGNS